MRSRGFLLEDYLSERIQSQPFKKAASESCRKMKGFFLDLKSSPENCVPQSPSLKRFISTKCFQIGNIQKNNRSQHLLSTHYVPGPEPCGLLKSHFVPPPALESRYHYYPHLQREKSWSKEVKSLDLGHPVNKWKSLPSNLCQPESKTCESTTRQEIDIYGLSHKQYCSPINSLYCNNFETWLIIRA